MEGYELKQRSQSITQSFMISIITSILAKIGIRVRDIKNNENLLDINENIHNNILFKNIPNGFSYFVN